MSVSRAVPCGTCTLCCKYEAIILHPEDGDDFTQYETTIGTNPFSGQPVHMLKQRKDGTCTYLGPFGCSIYNRRPAICRSFDCRVLVKRIDETRARALIANGQMTQEVYDRGRALVHTLQPSPHSKGTT
jgi:uncharacterized protein